MVVINATKDEYLAKHVDAEAKKAAADQLLSALEDDFQYLEKSDDVNQKYANRVKEIRTAINALKDKVAKDYKAPTISARPAMMPTAMPSRPRSAACAAMLVPSSRTTKTIRSCSRRWALRRACRRSSTTPRLLWPR